MDLKELEGLKNCNEFDLVNKIIQKSEAIKKRAEQLIKGKGNKSAGVDVRKAMQDVRLISEIVRDEIQRRKFPNQPFEESRLHKAIEAEKKRLAREEERIKKLEERRIIQR